MKKGLLLLSLFACIATFAQKPDTLWFKYDDRFVANDVVSLENTDSIMFQKTGMMRYKYNPTTDKVTRLSWSYRSGGTYHFDELERYLVKPNTYSSCDFTKETSEWCFQRSMESEHFVCFWQKGLEIKNNTISLGGSSINVKTLLSRGETIWKKYVQELGFLDLPNVKIEMFIVNQTEWRADGSGTDGTTWYYDGTTKKSKSAQVGLFHCNPWAASAEGGHTAAHEIGHVFQYLISAIHGTSRGWRWGYGDNGSGGCAWWESCAQWQAFNVYPSTLFTNGYYGQMLSNSYKSILHEDWRYANYFIQYYWCQLLGKDFIGKLWQATKFPEDPVDTFLRMNNMSLDEFNKIFFDYACRAITWDIDDIRDRGKNYQNQFSTTLKYVEGTENTYIVDAACCPQNYGMNIIPLKGITAGTTVKCAFKGVAGTDGYRKLNVAKAGWRYGFVAQTTDGQRVYGNMYSDKEGVAEMTLPENTQRAWFVVTGAPTSHWHHPWDDSATNDEQWPYQVTFDGCAAKGTTRTYGDYPDDYVRRDTTAVIDAELAYSSSSYSYVDVQLDVDAISRALGVSTAQMKAAVCGKKTTKPYLRIAALNADGKTETNSKTISDSDVIFGNWFSTSGKVGGYDNSAAIYTKIYHDSYICRIGQYPGRLSKGKTYKVRHAVIYTDASGKEYKATMEINLAVK